MAEINLYKRKEPEEKPQESLFKRFVNWLKGEGMDDAQINEEIQKAAETFNEQLMRRSTEEIEDEIWNVVAALRSSLYSIIVDTEMDTTSKPGAMNESVSQFTTALQEYIPKWCSGQTAIAKSADDSETIERMEADYQRLGEMIGKLKPAVKENSEGEDPDDEVDPPKEGSKKKGDTEEMKVDKSKLSPEMQTAYDELIAKGVLVPGEEDEVAAAPNEGAQAPEPAAPEGVEKKATVDPEIEELKKGLQAEISALKKQREEAEDAALMAVAKKYEVLGRKPEELAKKFKALKSVSEDLYNDEISALDELAKSMEQNVFGEIGKSRSGGSEDAIAKARAMATELQKSNPALSDAQALDQVLLTNDELRKELDQ